MRDRCRVGRDRLTAACTSSPLSARDDREETGVECCWSSAGPGSGPYAPLGYSRSRRPPDGSTWSSPCHGCSDLRRVADRGAERQRHSGSPRRLLQRNACRTQRRPGGRRRCAPDCPRCVRGAPKVRYVGYLFANVAAYDDIDAGLAALMLGRAEALTWRQYVLLATDT